MARRSDIDSGQSRRVLARRPELLRGRFARERRGECRAPDAPAARVRLVVAHGSHRRSPDHPAFPHANGFNGLCRALPATNSSCHRRRRIEGCVAARLGSTKTSADLTPATGARTTRFCRPRNAFAKRSCGPCARQDILRSRLQRRSSCAPSIAHRRSLPCDQPARPTLPRPPHPAPTFVTMCPAPSSPGRDSGGL